MDRTTDARARWGPRIGLSALVVGLLGILSGIATHAAFSDTTVNSGNGFTAGTVALTDNDADGPVLTLTNAVPDDTDSGCIIVDYVGTLPASVRLYGTTTGTGLDQYLNVTVTRGTIAGSPSPFDSCNNFVADSTNYVGAGAGVLYFGTLAAFPDSYASGIVDPSSGTPETWTTGESHVYRFDVILQDNAAAQGLDAAQEFTWEARNN